MRIKPDENLTRTRTNRKTRKAGYPTIAWPIPLRSHSGINGSILRSVLGERSPANSAASARQPESLII
jgi:hypothetical protein